MPDPGRSYDVRRWRLELAGEDAGVLRSVEGGEPYGAVVLDAAPSPGGVVGKHLGSVHYADIVMECGVTPDAPLASWIGATLARTAPVRDGAVVALDSANNEVSRLAFQKAVIREIAFPALDAASKDAAYLTLRLAPESTRRVVGAGAKYGLHGLGAKEQRVSGFRLRIDGVSAASASHVAPLVVRHDASTGAGLEISDLIVTVREAEDWYAWRDAFIVNRTGSERSATLDYLAADMRQVHASIELRGLGIHSLVAERFEAGEVGMRRLRASMYCENLSYGPPGPASLASAPPGSAAPSRVDAIASLASRQALSRSRLV